MARRADDRGTVSLVICRGPFYLPKRHLLRIFAIYGFVVNRDIVKFFRWAAACLVVGLRGQK